MHVWSDRILSVSQPLIWIFPLSVGLYSSNYFSCLYLTPPIDSIRAFLIRLALYYALQNMDIEEVEVNQGPT